MKMKKMNQAKRIALSLVMGHMWIGGWNGEIFLPIPEVYKVFSRSCYKKTGTNSKFEGRADGDPKWRSTHSPIYTEAKGSVVYTLYTSGGEYKVKIGLLHTDPPTNGYDCWPEWVKMRNKEGVWELLLGQKNFQYFSCGSYAVDPHLVPEEVASRF